MIPKLQLNAISPVPCAVCNCHLHKFDPLSLTTSALSAKTHDFYYTLLAHSIFLNHLHVTGLLH